MRPAILGLFGGLVPVAVLPVWLAAGIPARAQDASTQNGPAQYAPAQYDSREAILQRDQMLYQQHEQQLQSQAGGGSMVAPPSGPGSLQQQPGGDGLTAQLLDRISTLEAQVRDLRGRLDQLTNQVQQQNAALAKQVGDLNFAAQQSHAAPPPAVASPAPSRTAPSRAGSAATRKSPEAALAQGQRELARRDYQAAAADARDALAVRGPHQIEAQYLLAQSLAGERQYQQAATAYYDVYSRSPRSSRAPDALLGVSASLLALGDRADACQALQKMRAEFPEAGAHQRSAAAALHGRAGCH